MKCGPRGITTVENELIKTPVALCRIDRRRPPPYLARWYEIIIIGAVSAGVLLRGAHTRVVVTVVFQRF